MIWIKYGIAWSWFIIYLISNLVRICHIAIMSKGVQCLVKTR